MGKLTELGRIIVVMFIFAFLIGFVHASALMYMLAFACLALLVVSFSFARWGGKKIECLRELPDAAIFSGDPYETTIILRETSARWRWLEVFDQQVNLFSGKTSHRRMSVMIEGGASNSVSIFGVRQPMVVHGTVRQVEMHDLLLFPYRGRYRLGPLKLTSTDLFGICTYRCSFAKLDEVLVYPSPLPMREVAIAGDSGRRNTPRREVLRAGESIDFYGIRPYVQGDDLRRVHWKSTAHTGKLTVKEYQFQTAGGVQLLLDLQHNLYFGKEEFSTLEVAVTLASSIIHYALDNGNQIGLLTTGAHIHAIAPDSGTRQMQRTMESLAMAEQNGSTPLARVLASDEMPSSERNTLIIISPTTDINILAPLLSMQGQSSHILLILIDVVSFQQSEEKKAKTERFSWGSPAAGIQFRLHIKRGNNLLPPPEAHGNLLRAAIASGIDTYSINADLPLHQALQGIRGHL